MNSSGNRLRNPAWSSTSGRVLPFRREGSPNLMTPSSSAKSSLIVDGLMPHSSDSCVGVKCRSVATWRDVI